MHTLTMRTKYTFGDRVRYKSRDQDPAGVGKIYGIAAWIDGPHDYLIQLDDGDIVGGILEEEITLIDDGDAESLHG